MKRFTKFIATTMLLMIGLVLVSQSTYAAYLPDSWELDEDGYYYYSVDYEQGLQTIESKGPDLYYQYNTKDVEGGEVWSEWIKVPDFNEYIQGATGVIDYSKVKLDYDFIVSENNVNHIYKIQQWSGGTSNEPSMMDEVVLSGYVAPKSSGNTELKFRFQKDTTSPVINGQTTFTTNINNPKQVTEFITELTATDNIDGDLSNQIYIKTDGYTDYVNTPGTYNVVLGVKDVEGNEGVLSIHITIVDNDVPVISGNDAIEILSYESTFAIEEFRSTLTVSDNFDELTNSDIVLKADGYTSNKTNLGTYNLVFEVIDSSGNIGTFSKQVKVIDDVEPVIIGPDSISTNNIDPITLDEIISKLSASDVKSGDLTSEIIIKTNGYENHNKQPGVYTITFSVKDESDNEASHAIDVTIEESDDDTEPISPVDPNPTPTNPNPADNGGFELTDELLIYTAVGILILIIIILLSSNKKYRKRRY